MTNLIALYNEMASSVDERRGADVVYLDIVEASDTLSYNILVDKLMKYGLDKWTVRQFENWLSCQAQRVVISGTKHSWEPLTTGVHQWSVLGPVLFNVFINNLDDVAECALGKFADDTNLGEVADAPEGSSAIQRDLDGQEEWADSNFMKFDKGKCKCLYVGRNNPIYHYTIEANWLESSFAEKDLGLLVVTKLNMS